MPNVISSSYDPTSSRTTTEGNLSATGDSDFEDFLKTMIRRRLNPKPKPGFGGTTVALVPSHHGSGDEGMTRDPLAGLKAMDQYEGTLKGAATRGTGFGPGMIPGEAVDPRLLPSRLLPSGSGGGQLFAGAGPSGGQAGPTPGPPPGQLSGQYTSGAPDTGLNYMSPSEQARWRRLLSQ